MPSASGQRGEMPGVRARGGPAARRRRAPGVPTGGGRTQGVGRRAAAVGAVTLGLCALHAPGAGAQPPPASLTERLDSCGPVRVGGPAPEFGGWSVDGHVVTLRRLLHASGRKPSAGLVLSFFATWCKPCKAGLPLLASLAPGLGERGVSVLLVAVGEDAGQVRPFLAGLGVGLPALEDKFGKVAERYGVGGAEGGVLPRTFVLDGQGRVRAILGREGTDFGAALLAALPKGDTRE